MSRWFLLLAVIPLAVIPILVGGDEVDERVSARPGGELKVDVVLGSGLAFDKGSLQVTSHESEDEVHVRVETSGGGRYAVDVDIDETPSGVRVDVEGSRVHDESSGEQFTCEPIPPHLMRIIEDGGLLNHLERRLARDAETKQHKASP